MGAGGRSMPRAPASKPPFTVGELKKAIPPHCFQRSAIRSMSYVVQDLILVSFFYYIATNYFHLLPHPLSYLAWPLYWACTGSVLMGIWVIAHECGHHAFSNYHWFNDVVGLILHSALLTPYFSWKLSHRRHHSNTSSLEKDEVFVPKLFSKKGWLGQFIDDSPLLRIIIRMTIGWPLYLWFNLSGRKYDGYVSHFYPYSPVFLDHERVLIFITDMSVLAMLYGLYCLAAAKGLVFVICVYGIPLAIVNGFLVTITYLHHTHASIPHYDSSEWDWLRGALATIDRDFGILNHVLHHINDTHVVHHLFPIIPHYYATDATNAIKPILGNYYQFDGTSLPMAVWREAKECLYIVPDEDVKAKGVFWYNGKAN